MKAPQIVAAKQRIHTFRPSFRMLCPEPTSGMGT